MLCVVVVVFVVVVLCVLLVVEVVVATAADDQQFPTRICQITHFGSTSCDKSISTVDPGCVDTCTHTFCRLRTCYQVLNVSHVYY